MEALAPWAPWVAILIALASLGYSISVGRSNDSKSRMKDQDTRIGTLAGKIDIVEDKVTRIEGELKHLPSKDTAHNLEVALGKMETQVVMLSERIKPLAAMADRMQEAMLEKVMGQQ